MGHVDDRELIPLRPAFDIVRRGYDRTQVDDRIDELQANLRIVTADSEAGAAQAAELSWQLESARQELDEARRELRALSEPPDTVEGMSARVKRMLRLAQDEAADIRAKAESGAAEKLAEAEKNATGLRTRYEQLLADTKQRRIEMQAEHERLVAQAKQQATDTIAQADNQATETVERANRQATETVERANQQATDTITEANRQATETVAHTKQQATDTIAQADQQASETVAHATQHAADLEAASEAKRRQVEEDFEITMSARRAEAGRMLAEEEETSKREAQRRVDEAGEVARRVVTDADQRATAMIGEATQRVDNLRVLRQQVADQLRSVSATLDNAFQHLTPHPDEDTVLLGGRPGQAPPAADQRPAAAGRNQTAVMPRQPS